MTAPAKKEKPIPVPAPEITPEQQQMAVDNINAMMGELQEQNTILSQRCARLRGELAVKERLIGHLNQTMDALTKEIEALKV